LATKEQESAIRLGLMRVWNGNGSAVNMTIDCSLVAGDRDRNRNVAPVDVLAAIRLAVRGECSPEVNVEQRRAGHIP
jgi:hypothetical protein